LVRGWLIISAAAAGVIAPAAATKAPVHLLKILVSLAVNQIAKS
jgi:hypothetical protein